MRGDVYGAGHPFDSDTRTGLPRMETLGLASTKSVLFFAPSARVSAPQPGWAYQSQIAHLVSYTGHIVCAEQNDAPQ